jgi:branched-chain amino acid transport system permease protein
VSEPSSATSSSAVPPSAVPTSAGVIDSRLLARTSGRHRLARTLVTVAVLAAVAVLFQRSASAQYLYLGDTALIAAIGAIGLQVLAGSAGQVSIGNAAFMGIGAYSVVLWGYHVGLLGSMVLGGLVSALAGLLVGFPSLRLRGLYLVFSTLALNYLVGYLLEEYDNATNATAGHTIPSASVVGLALGTDTQWFYFLVVVVALVGLATAAVERGRPGRAWDAVRANEASAAIIGINVSRAKLLAFVYSSFLTGLSGAIFAYFAMNISSDYFSLTLAVSYIAMTLIGGIDSIGGAIAGAIVITAVPTITTNIGTSLLGGGTGNSTSFLQQNLPFIDSGVYVLLILVFMFVEPRGIAQLGRRAYAWSAATLRHVPLAGAGGDSLTGTAEAEAPETEAAKAGAAIPAASERGPAGLGAIAERFSRMMR